MLFFFFNDTATTEIYTLSLHDALPISNSSGEISSSSSRICASSSRSRSAESSFDSASAAATILSRTNRRLPMRRSEEHTSELQSQSNLVCRLLLEKKKIKAENPTLDIG